MPTFGMTGIVGQPRGTGRMEPMQLPVDVRSGFIEMHHGFLLGQVFLDRFIHRGYLFSHGLTRIEDGAFRQRMLKHIGKGLADPL